MPSAQWERSIWKPQKQWHLVLQGITPIVEFSGCKAQSVRFTTVLVICRSYVTSSKLNVKYSNKLRLTFPSYLLGPFYYHFLGLYRSDQSWPPLFPFVFSDY